MRQSETLISLNEYLNTSYSPDCEYVDGRVLERNWRERDHDRSLHEPPFVRADDGFLTTQNPDITVSLPELYRSQE